jgi:hypothetical protein
VFDSAVKARVKSIEWVVHEPWRIASRQRSSRTREYIGAVTSLADLRQGRGEFSTEDEFYTFWRKYTGFRTTGLLEREVARLLRERGEPTD